MPAIVGWEKVSPVIKSALCKHIMHEREKRKQGTYLHVYNTLY